MAYGEQEIALLFLLLRKKYLFNGYIHVKCIPGAPDDLLSFAGYLADRISVNLELPTQEGLKQLAPNKTFKTILEPMGKITDTIAAHRLAIGKDERMERSAINQYLPNSIFHPQNRITDQGFTKKNDIAVTSRSIHHFSIAQDKVVCTF